MLTDYYEEALQCVDQVIEKVGKEIVLGTPLALGKPNHILNAFYQRAKEDPSIKLKILTALTLGKPKGKSLLESRFIEPFGDRVFGNYPDIQYAVDREKGELPENIQIIEFYYPAGKLMGVHYAQENYISTNYTHVARDMIDHGVNVLAQMVAKREEEGEVTFSLSCNPDVTIDLVPLMLEKQKKNNKAIAFVAQVNNNLPYMYGDCVVPQSYFTHVLDNKDLDFDLFGPPKMAVSEADFAIGLYSSALIKDGGCLQVGIGSMGDAVNYGLILREKNNAIYKDSLSSLGAMEKWGDLINEIGGVESFDQGLFGATEMFVDGFMDLYENDILKKTVYNDETLMKLLNDGEIKPKFDKNILDHLLEEKRISSTLHSGDVEFLRHFGILKDKVELVGDDLILEAVPKATSNLNDLDNKNIILEHYLGDELKDGHVIHGGFFLGPKKFYQWLNDLSDAERKRFFMTSVGGINQLYWSENIDTLQRKDARFINSGLFATLSGAVCSDGLENGEIISGVGGQYNFVSMAHAIPGGRSILKIRSTRFTSKGVESNIMWNYGHTTIPRHLRDIIVTEYGIANLRGRTDEEIIIELLKISDSRFQDDLMDTAKKYGKLNQDYQIPLEYRSNYPEKLSEVFSPFLKQGFYQKFPFGTDLTDQEIIVGGALKRLKKATKNKGKAILLLLSNLVVSPSSKGHEESLKRMGLEKPQNFKEKFFRKLLLRSLNNSI